jgi:primary-amine oxidase
VRWGIPLLTCGDRNLQDKLHEAIVDLSKGQVESIVRLSPEHHGSSDGEELIRMEKIALEDEGVKTEIAKLQLPPGTVVISDPWIYGRDPV